MDAIHLDKHSKRMQTRLMIPPYTSKKNNLYHEKHSGVARWALAMLDLPHQMDAIHLDKHSKRMQTRPLNIPYTSKKNVFICL